MNFRRCILAMAVLSLFVGIASAQVINSGAQTSPSITCVANVAAPPQLRAEGMTELIGDIVLICTGGQRLAPGSPIPTANITVSLGTNVTSRLISNAFASNASEALLLIDEPNTSTDAIATGVGPTLPFTLCQTGTGPSPNPTVGAGPGGCASTISTRSAGGTGPAPGEPAGSCAVNGGGNTNCTAAPNTFQGLVVGNQVTFLGIPVAPPNSAGYARYYRITNIRANASALAIGNNIGTSQLVASVSVTNALPLTQPIQIAGFVQNGLSTSLQNGSNTGGFTGTSLAQCGGGNNPASLAILRYTENFGTAFKTRIAPTLTENGQGLGVSQNRPGTIYNSESGLVLSQLGTTGLADFGTRLKAVFNNVPTGVRIFVSTTNVTNNFVPLPFATAPPGVSTSSYAQLVISETAPDGNGFAPVQSGNTAVTINNASLNLFEVPLVNGSGTAVWEVINTNANVLETLNFGVYQRFTANPGAGTPPVGTATVGMSYAPTPPNAGFSAAAGAVASSTLPIPRFADTTVGRDLLSISLCQTVLLYPFLTDGVGGGTGLTTGIAIANTTRDPFGTANQSGNCVLNFYGDTAPGPVTTANIPTGTVYTATTQSIAAGFQGYMIAVCNFQLAHGYAAITDFGLRNILSSYLALVLPDGTGSRNNRTEALNQ